METNKATLKQAARKSYHHADLASELLGAAELELSENGMEAFSLRAVAKRAGVSHGAPAHHFGDVRGLLTALAAIGYQRLVKAQDNRQRLAKADPRSQIVATGLGYIDFAVQNPALFRLMVSSEKPDRTDDRFGTASLLAFDKLVADVRNLGGSDPYTDPAAMKNVVASWAMVHGLADLMISGRMERPLGVNQMAPAELDEVLADLMFRAIKE
tara:strand:+ start:1844 stop:2482 length:639 start_codon:yes stop_codon:yes gene_type:complete